MRVILVDDEPLLLAHLEKLLLEVDGVELVGKYTNPCEAKEAILREKPDVVFLDIEMPEINGIELAEKIQTALPEVHIVFITAYSEYAVKAFELNAVDYILKPLKREQLIKTLQRFQNTNNSVQLSVQIPMVCCFQSLHFINGDSQKLQIRWRTNKAKELFLFLLQHREKPVRKEQIMEEFWPETEWDKAHTKMYTTVYQIRKALEAIHVDMKIENHEESYILHLNGVKHDVDEWEKGISQYSSVSSETLSFHRKIMALYKGDYLEDMDDTWVESERERLRILWFNHMKKLADYFTVNGEYEEAIQLCTRIQELHPYAEYSYFMLMQLYAELSDRYQVEIQYEKLTHIAAEHFNLPPSKDVQIWYECWKKKSKGEIE